MNKNDCWELFRCSKIIPFSFVYETFKCDLVEKINEYWYWYDDYDSSYYRHNDEDSLNIFVDVAWKWTKWIKKDANKKAIICNLEKVLKKALENYHIDLNHSYL